MLRKLLANGVEWVCILLLVVVSLDLLLGVYSRYVLERTFTWYDEIARACFIWLVFLGAAVAVKRGAHFGLHMLVDGLPPRLKRAASVLTPLAIIAFSLALIVQGWKLVALGQFQTTAVMGMPVSWIYLAMPAGGVLMILYSLPALRHTLSGTAA
jgi:TRAP-type C4-dicarboxylate transport system permease small subunit